MPYIHKAGFLNKIAKIPSFWKNTAEVCYTGQKDGGVNMETKLMIGEKVTQQYREKYHV